MCAIGYGDFAPYGSSERICGVLTMMISSGVFGFLIGNIGTIIEKQGMKQKIRRETIVNLNIFMKNQKFSTDLTNKTRQYMEYVFRHDQDSNCKINELLNALSRPLQEEIMMYTNGSVIHHCPSFDIFSDTFIHKFAKIIDVKIFSPSDIILKEGSLSIGMHFITNGVIEVYDQCTNCRLKLLSDGDFIGEIGLLLAQSCIASASAVNFVETLHLGSKEFEAIISKNITMKNALEDLRNSCVEGNYFALGIICYLCGKAGHIAKNCCEFMNDEKIKKKWIYRNGLSRFVNTEDQNKRKKRVKVYREDYSSRNIIGIKRNPESLFPKITSLAKGVINYIRRKKQNNSNGQYIITEESRDNSLIVTNVFRHPEWILSSHEDEREDSLLTFHAREKGFDTSLIK